MVEEFVLIERGEYNRLEDNPTSNVSFENKIVSDTAPGSSMLSINHLLSAVKNKVGIMYHNKVDQFFKFLKSHPSILTWTDFGETIVNGIHLPGTNVHEMLYYLFHDWRKFSKQSPPQGLDKLIPVLLQNGFDPQNVVNRKLKVLSHANEVCKRPLLSKKKTKNCASARYKVVNLLKENHRRSFSRKKMEQNDKKRELLKSHTRIQIDKRRGTYVSH